jgi:hypothetical protein
MAAVQVKRMEEVDEGLLVWLVVSAGGRVKDFVSGWSYSLTGERDLPDTGFGVSGSFDDDGFILVNFDIVSSERGFVAVITKGAHG